MAGRAEAPDFAGEGDKQVMPAIIAADSGKSLAQVAALDELIGRNPHGWSVKTVFCAVPLRGDPLELIIMGGDNFPATENLYRSVVAFASCLRYNMSNISML